jgi:hypothetical protein
METCRTKRAADNGGTFYMEAKPRFTQAKESASLTLVVSPLLCYNNEVDCKKVKNANRLDGE